MKIAELFYSIQGEGTLIGAPSVFIRTSGCNLRCHWCDTPYTSWHAEGDDMPLDSIMDYVKRHSTGYTVITGGEPMIAPQIVTLTEALRQRGQHITIETAGTVFAPVRCDLMSISPKLGNSTPHQRDEGRWAAQHDRLRLQPSVLRRLMHAYEHQLKFVVVSPEDVREIEDVVATAGAARNRVVLMPEGVDAAGLQERSVWVAEVCKERGWRFSPRLHVQLWGNRRGT
jgi:7-carboxy-7-deazaguanine synthase